MDKMDHQDVKVLKERKVNTIWLFYYCKYLEYSGVELHPTVVQYYDRLFEHSVR